MRLWVGGLGVWVWVGVGPMVHVRILLIVRVISLVGAWSQLYYGDVLISWIIVSTSNIVAST